MSFEDVKAVCEYMTVCDECGEKIATWIVDKPTQSEIMKSFVDQLNAVAIPNHEGHDWKISYFRVMEKENDNTDR